jgi:outer membrane receptor protein involved in Fe transport
LLQNNGNANVIGLESVITANLSKQLRVQGWYSLSVTNASFDGQGDSSSSDRNEDSTPINQASLKAFYTLNDQWNFSTGLRYVDSVSLFEIPSYIAGSVRIGYKPISSFELALGIENLFAPNHIEYQSDYISIPRSEIPTLGYLQAKVTF